PGARLTAREFDCAETGPATGQVLCHTGQCAPRDQAVFTRQVAVWTSDKGELLERRRWWSTTPARRLSTACENMASCHGVAHQQHQLHLRVHLPDSDRHFSDQPARARKCLSKKCASGPGSSHCRMQGAEGQQGSLCPTSCAAMIRACGSRRLKPPEAAIRVAKKTARSLALGNAHAQWGGSKVLRRSDVSKIIFCALPAGRSGCAATESYETMDVLDHKTMGPAPPQLRHTRDSRNNTALRLITKEPMATAPSWLVLMASSCVASIRSPSLRWRHLVGIG
uniref:SRCR domain-containing protein n=1 Tax=Macrostomum lignano TaxID=282301 RepID=A0A1I8JND6_9PLAT